MTLCALRKDGFAPALLVGSDKLPELPRWKYIAELIREFGIVCLARGGDDCRGIIDADPFLKELQDRITLLDTPDDWRDISSSKVREALRQGRQEDLARMVPEEILPMLLPAL